MGDVERALAFVALRRGRTTLPEADWRNILSLDLGWMPPGQAASFVARAVAAGTLWPDGDALRLAFDPATVEVPFGFRPRAEAQPESGQDPFAGWVQRLATHLGVATPQVMEQVAARQAALGGLLTALAALLWLAAEAGLDVRSDAARFRA